MAIAGDRVRIDKSGVFVNEVPLTWVSRDFAANYGERQPWDAKVPEGHYVVIADYRMNQEVSQFLGSSRRPPSSAGSKTSTARAESCFPPTAAPTTAE